MSQQTLHDYQYFGSKCPTCFKDFKSHKGMLAHHARTHGEKLRISKTCETCGEKYEVKPKKAQHSRFCSRECMDNVGRDMVTLICDHCGDEYEVTPSRANQSNYCSKECTGRAGLGMRTAEHYTKECSWCGTEFEVVESMAGIEHCSQSCAQKSRARKENPYPPNWRLTVYNTLRRKITPSLEESTEEALENRCEMCGKESGELNNNLDLHHIVPLLQGGTNEPWNLMTVCRSCHQSAEQISEKVAGMEKIHNIGD